MRGFIGGIWDKLNPAEPSASYLVKFMAVILAIFAIAMAIGQGWL